VRRILAVLALALLTALPASARRKLEVSAYLGIVPHVGDFRIYESYEGACVSISTDTVVSVEPWKHGWVVEVERRTGDLLSWVKRDYVIPGRMLLADDVLGMALPRPEPAARLVTRVPGALPTLLGVMGLGGGNQPLKNKVSSWVAGFELLETPTRFYPSVLRVDVEELRFGGTPPRWDRNVVSHWYLAGVGLVASQLAYDPAPYEWLVAAQINDVSLP
jgi:hypothetical protein